MSFLATRNAVVLNHDDGLAPAQAVLHTSRSEPKAIYFLGPDTELLDQVNAQLVAAGICANFFETIADLTSSLQSAPEAVLVLDTDVLSRRQSIVQLIDYLGARVTGVAPAFVCVAQTDTVEQRLDAMRSGASAFFSRPLELQELVDKLVELSAGTGGMPSRVLIVSDEPVEAAVVAEVLEQAGVETRRLDAPLTLIDDAQAFGPELILMDSQMAEAGGLELTRILRDHDSLFGMPVVLMAAAGSDQEAARSAALRAGADDCLMKPPRPAQLVEVVECRARRVRTLRRKLKMTADRDSVTGLNTKRRLLQYVDQSLRDRGFQGAGRGVLFIEIDGPDQLAAAMGFGGGDALLVHVANLIKAQLGPSELAARVGDYSFAVAAARVDDATLDAVAEIIRRIVSERLVGVAGTQVLATVSIGVRRLRSPMDDVVTLIAEAEKACTRARAGGGNRVEVHAPRPPPGQADSQVDEIQLLIEKALTSDGFQQLYQPILAVRGQAGARYDALLRLRSSDGKLMNSNEFLSVARRRGLMMKVDRWVMDSALKTLAQQRDAGRKVQVFVHQAMSSIQAKSWVLWMRDQLLKRALVESPPVLQLALMDVLENLPVANARFEMLHKLGVRLCVAGFDDRPGALTLLQMQPISTVKLSLEMVQEKNQARLIHLSQRVHDLRRTVVAVGIEEPGTINRVMECGVDFIQGDFVQPPQDGLHFDFSDSHRTS